MKYRQWGCGVAFCLAAAVVCGCPSGKAPVLGVSDEYHEIALGETSWSFTVTNSGPEGSSLSFTISKNVDWLNVSPASGTALASGASQTVTVTVDASAMASKSLHDGTLYVVASKSSQVREVHVRVRVDRDPPAGLVLYPNDDDSGQGIKLIRTSDGGFALLCGYGHYGNIDSSGIIKTNSRGVFQWGVRWSDQYVSIAETESHRFEVVGDGYDSDNGRYCVIQSVVDADGDFVSWQTLGNVEDAICADAVRTSTGGYVVVGSEWDSSQQDWRPFVLSAGSNGETLWKQNPEFGVYYEISAVAAVPGGGYLMSGWAAMEEGIAGGLVRLDGDGEGVWDHTYLQFLIQDLATVSVLTDGSILAAGANEGRAALLNVAANGAGEWSCGLGPQKESALSGLTPLSDGGFLALGWTAVRLGDFGEYDGRMMVARFASNSNVLWCREYGGPGPDEAVAAVETTEGYVVLGTTGSYGPQDTSPCLLFLDKNGNPRVP